MIIEIVAGIASALTIAAVTACAGILWKMNTNVTTLTSQLTTSIDNMNKRFDDHSKFIELILDRVLPDRK